MLDAVVLVFVGAVRACSSAFSARISATPPPGTTPSSTAARVACSASSTRAFFSFISISVDSADLDHGDAAGELGNALLQLLLVVVGGGFLDLRLICSMRALMSAALPAPSMIVVFSFSTCDLLGVAEVLERGLLERQADFLGDHRAAGQDRDVLQHGLATIAEARRLDGADLDDAADGVDDQRRQRFAFDVLGDDQQRLARLGDAFEQRQQLADVRDLLVVQQDERVLELGRLVCWLLMKYGER